MGKVLALLDRGEGGAEELHRRGYDFQGFMEATPEGKVEFWHQTGEAVTPGGYEYIK